MKRTRVLLLFASFLLYAGAVLADVVWSASEYDYGTIKEADGVCRGRVYMTNTGSDTVQMRAIKPSCGCTAAGYTKDFVAPGDSVEVWFDYNPAGRPGPFAKNVRVYLSPEGSKAYMIKFKGTVVATDETLMLRYPHVAGPMRLSTVKLKTGPVTYGKGQTLYITAYNLGETPVSPDWDTKGLPITVAKSAELVAPGEMVTFSVYYNSCGDDMVGEASREFLIYPDGRDSEPAVITLESNIAPDPAAYTAEQMASAPVLTMQKDLSDIGTVDNAAKPVKVEFELENKGKSVLHIGRIYCKEEGVSVKRMPLRLEPGKKGKVIVNVFPALIPEGPFHFKVEICSDDPVHPFMQYRIVGIKE